MNMIFKSKASYGYSVLSYYNPIYVCINMHDYACIHTYSSSVMIKSHNQIPQAFQCKTKIHNSKQPGNLLYYCHDIEHETGLRKIKIPSTFNLSDLEANRI